MKLAFQELAPMQAWALGPARASFPQQRAPLLGVSLAGLAPLEVSPRLAAPWLKSG